MAPVSKEESQSSSSRKTTSSTRPEVQEQPVLKCPRCDSMNTKFCYFNNYNLTQPRHFCKTCRRYWTKGGALRNVPIGGGCRKNKKMKSSSSSNLSGDSSTSSDINGLKYFHGVSPSMDFHLGGGLNFPRLQQHSTTTGGTAAYNQFSSFGDISSTSGSSIVSTPCFNLNPSANPVPLMGFNFPFPSLVKQDENDAAGFNGEVQEMGSGNLHNSSNIASSIESLSCINQDLHWKLQQQRFAMLFSGENQKENRVSSMAIESQIQKPQPILFQNLEMVSRQDDYAAAGDNSRKEGGSSGNLATEWFFDNSYAAVVNPTSTNDNNNNNNANENGSNWNGVQSWTNLNHFNALP